MQFRQHATRLDMAFAGKEQSLTETAFQRGFEFGQRARVEPPVTGRQTRKALEIAAVAAVRHHQ